MLPEGRGKCKAERLYLPIFTRKCGGYRTIVGSLLGGGLGGGLGCGGAVKLGKMKGV